MVNATTTTRTIVVFAQQRDIEIPRLWFGFSRVHLCESSLAKAHWRESGRATQAFLRTAVDRVDFPFIHSQFVTTEARDRVHHEQSVPRAHQVCQPFERLMRAGAGLRMDNADEFRLRMFFHRGSVLFV